MGSSHGHQTIQGACVSETSVHDHGRRLNQREFRPTADVPFRSVHQLSEYKGKRASASGETNVLLMKRTCSVDRKCIFSGLSLSTSAMQIPVILTLELENRFPRFFWKSKRFWRQRTISGF